MRRKRAYKKSTEMTPIDFAHIDIVSRAALPLQICTSCCVATPRHESRRWRRRMWRRGEMRGVLKLTERRSLTSYLRTTKVSRLHLNHFASLFPMERNMIGSTTACGCGW